MVLSIKKVCGYFLEKIKENKVAKLAVVFFLPLCVLLSYTGLVRAEDLMSAGKETVTDTFGGNSAIAKWIILAEVIVGIITYIKTKNMFMLFGIAVVIVFTTIGFGLAG